MFVWKWEMYHLPRVIEETDPSILEKVNTHCYYYGLCLYIGTICIKIYNSERSQ